MTDGGSERASARGGGHARKQRSDEGAQMEAQRAEQMKGAGASGDGGSRKRARRPDESEREELEAQSRDVDVWLVKVPPYLMDEWRSRRE